MGHLYHGYVSHNQMVNVEGWDDFRYEADMAKLLARCHTFEDPDEKVQRPLQAATEHSFGLRCFQTFSGFFRHKRIKRRAAFKYSTCGVFPNGFPLISIPPGERDYISAAANFQPKPIHGSFWDSDLPDHREPKPGQAQQQHTNAEECNAVGHHHARPAG